MKKQAISLISLMAASVFFFSCEKQESSTELTPEERYQKEIHFLVDHFGFDIADIAVEEGNLVAEGDIIFDLNNFWENYLPSPQHQIQSDSNGNASIEERKHYRYTYLVSTPNPPRWITVNVNPAVPSMWQYALWDAIAAWNNLNLNVRFSVQNGYQPVNGAINVTYTYCTPCNWIAQASYPSSSGNPGSTITINTNYNNISYSKKIFALAHELGHTVGIRHTDGGQGTWVTNVSNTCKNNSDPSSVMRSVVANWSGFSFCDQQVFNVLY